MFFTIAEERFGVAIVVDDVLGTFSIITDFNNWLWNVFFFNLQHTFLCMLDGAKLGCFLFVVVLDGGEIIVAPLCLEL